MYIIKNAWVSITRDKSRNILIGIIILIVGAAVTIALAINNTANDLIGSYESAYEKEVTIAFDRENAMGNLDFGNRDQITKMSDKFNDMPSYSISDIESFADSEHIENYYYTYTTSLNGSNIEPATSDFTDNKTGDSPEMPSFGGFGGEMGGPNSLETSALDFTVTGYSSVESMDDFISGNYTITEIADDAWEKVFNGNYVFINSELAEYNNLDLGAKIILADEANHTFTFTVVGIYEEAAAGDSPAISIFSNSANTILTNSTAVANILTVNPDLTASLTPTFIIDDYANLETVQAEFYQKGLDESYILESNEEIANSGLTSIQNVKNFALTFLIITFVIGGVILFILNMINIRERKYEIGVFRTIGMSKVKLSLQFVSELLIVALISLALGAGLGAGLAGPISNSLLESEISNSNTNMENMQKNFGGQPDGTQTPPGETQATPSQSPSGPDFSDLKIGAPTVSAYESIDAIVNFGVILELLGIGLVLVLISSIASMISIQRFSPLTILKERS